MVRANPNYAPLTIKLGSSDSKGAKTIGLMLKGWIGSEDEKHRYELVSLRV